MMKNEPQKNEEEDDDYCELEQHVNWKKESKKNQTMEAFEEDYQCVGGSGSSFGVRKDLGFGIRFGG